MSPVVSALGGSDMKRATGTGSPPIRVSPTTGSSGRCSCPRRSCASHCSTNGVRSTRCGASGQPPPKSRVWTVSSSLAAITLAL